MGLQEQAERHYRRFRVGTHVVAMGDIVYADWGVRMLDGAKGVVVAPELVKPLVRIIWDDRPGDSFTTNVQRLDPCTSCEPFTHVRAPAKKAPLRERERAKASGEQVCRVCACSDRDACPGGCFWVAPDLCSACEGEA